ncbi:recombinase zinc beta ribbon domain-containing protein [Paenibacillus sp. RC84]|uniref:recombinase zinc beta ribbon domain-containing protein n=1 Tax=Paenibacillus sp. RC84 TaxID=3156252 RepID=UPI003517DEE7
MKKPPEEWIRIENHHEPILDKETFDDLQIILAGSKSIGRYYHEDRYLLTGLVVCAHCGSKMNGKMSQNYSKKLNSTNVHYRYSVTGTSKKSKCFFHSVKRDELETLIISRIQEVIKAAPGQLRKMNITASL